MSGLPSKPLSRDQVIEQWPTLRQSLLGDFDNCALSSFFSMKYGHGWSTSPQARGTLFHRTAAEILRTMQRYGHQTIPIAEALQILVEVCRQQDVEPRDIVRLPMRDVPELRMAVRKFAKDNAFSTNRIVDIERRLEAPISYTTREGVKVTRRVTGQLDVLLYAEPDEAIVIDWKATFGMPPAPRDAQQDDYFDEELKGLSFMGYFQQRVYGWLVMMAYRNIQKVTLREFYPYRTQARKATLHRAQLGDVEEEISVLVEHMDNALAQGAPSLTPGSDGLVNIDELAWWKPQPGRHCGFCLAPTRCPIPEDVRVAAGGAITSEESAARWTARLQIAEKIRQDAREGLKGYVESSGKPVVAKWSKGRLVIGWHKTARGRRFGFYVPDESDRGGHADIDRQIEEAMKDATARARRERGVRPRSRSTKRKVKT